MGKIAESQKREFALGAIAERINAEVSGDPDTPILGLGALSSAQPGDLSHLSSPTYKPQLKTTRASAVILKREDLEACDCAALIVDNPYLGFARASQLFAKLERLPGAVDASATIAASATVAASASIGAHVVIGEEVQVGDGAVILPNTVVGDRCHIGADTVLRANVTLYTDVTLGARCLIHSGVVIGADGFGFTPDEKGQWQGIAQIGGVRVGDDVSVGANTCIDCGTIEDTVIEDGVQIDNQVQIGHNCRVGAHTLLCGMVGLAGSTTIGKHCVFAGRSGAGGDHPIDVCDGVIVSACSVLSQSVDKPGMYSGSMLFHEHSKWRRNALRFASLDDLFKRVKKLEKRLRDDPE